MMVNLRTFPSSKKNPLSRYLPLSIPLSPPAPGSQQSTFYLYRFPYSGISYDWNHIIGRLLWPAPSTKHRLSKFILVAWISTLFLLMAGYCSLVRKEHTLFIHLSFDGHLGCFQFLYAKNKAVINIHVQGFGWTYVFISLVCITTSGISESYGNSMFSCLRWHQTVFQRGGAISHSHQQCMKALISPRSHRRCLLPDCDSSHAVFGSAVSWWLDLHFPDG